MLHISNVTKLINGQPLYRDASFEVFAGEKVGLVGPNGSGKTTLLRLIIGEERPDSGNISLQNKMTLSYFSQNVGEMRGRKALEEVVSGHGNLAKVNQEMRLLEKKLEDSADVPMSDSEMESTLNKLGDLQHDFEKMGGYDIEARAEESLTGLGIAPLDHHRPVEDFSGGQKMRIALARALIVMPDIILMDEPTNYLDMETILWLEQWLKNFKGAIVLTTHDREFMNNIVNKIVEVAQERVTVYTGNYDFYLREKGIRKQQNEASFDRQQAMLKKEEEFIARFKARASHAAQVQSRVKKLEKIDQISLQADEEEMDVMLPEIPRGGNDVITFQNLGKSWSDSQGNPRLVFQGLNGLVARQQKIAVVGVNGAGKSTFLKIIADKTPATTGTVTIGPSINMGYFGQFTLENLTPEYTVFEEVQAKIPRASDGFVRNLLAAFLFKGDDVFKKVRHLSGGEKARLVLAYLLTIPHNLLLLDEPTNHLDIKAREVLLDALKRYEGTILFVSHDRHFLKEVANRVFEVSNKAITLYEGNYTEYLAKTKK